MSESFYIQNSDNVLSLSQLKKILEKPAIKIRHRISILNYDESVAQIIPDLDILDNGISYTEEYQQGQRRNITLQLFNNTGKYTPSINNIWMDTKFSYEVGVEYSGNIVWFPKGIYLLGNIEAKNSLGDKTISLQLKDKFFMFESNAGTLEDAYEVPVDSTIQDVVKGLLNFATGNGYVFDLKPCIFDSSLINFKTQATIRIDAGGKLGDIIKELATQMSADYYYNEVGNLCFEPLDEVNDDSIKPVIWTYNSLGRDLHNMDLNYDNEGIVNYVKIVSDNIDNGIYSAIIKNENPSSPICIGRIGSRISKYSESNVWSNETAESLGRYYLRQSSCINVSFSCPVSFNPILSINNLCEVEDEFFGLERDKLLINSISFTSGASDMTLSLVNTKDLPF